LSGIASRSQLQEKIEINNLDPEDKEKILRLIFAKMNSGMPPTPWRKNLDLDRTTSVRQLRQINQEMQEQ
jgi:hypothetical protein